MDRRQTGTLAENSAAAFLESQGFTIVARNFQRRVGEIDVVAARATAGRGRSAHARERPFGGPRQRQPGKQRRVAATTALFLQQRPSFAAAACVSTCIVVGWRIEWLKHAFDA
jgi:putative endonuclease